MNKEKNYFMQEVRGVLIICVIVIHCLGYSRTNEMINYFNISVRTIVNFCVATFIFMAAYFVKQNEVNYSKKDFYKKRIKRLLVPFFIWSFIYSIIWMIRNYEEIQIMGLVKSFLLGTNAPQLYYLIVLLQLTAITPVLIKIVEKRKVILDIIIFAITPIYTIFVALFQYKFGRIFSYYNIIFVAWITFYYLGLWIKNKKWDINKMKIRKISIVLIGIVIVFIMVNMLEYNKGCIYSYCATQIKLTNVLYSAIICILIFAISQLSVKRKQPNWLYALGDLSFGIYLIHYIFILISKAILEPLQINYIMQSIIMIVSTLIISFITIKSFKKLSNHKVDVYLGL